MGVAIEYFIIYKILINKILQKHIKIYIYLIIILSKDIIHEYTGGLLLILLYILARNNK
ncbi:hypothetical protein GCM10011383_07330 [Hymenobacter cavernae]|uniref:Uncharacterized protein n=1 Tax=Hymenobacter cavernae TaxID=2044852 RepID=A0ABQ1TR35_9BACT|nr:hypothetical protein GCM10011383_07330 [Hymenobacter cavernae]